MLPEVDRHSLRGSKFAVSITSVSPSQCPRDSPDHWSMSAGSVGRPSSGTMRAVFTISVTIAT